MIGKLKTLIGKDITNGYIAPASEMVCQKPDPNAHTRMLEVDELVELAKDPIYQISANAAKDVASKDKYFCGTYIGDQLTAYNFFATGELEPRYNSAGTGFKGIGIRMPENVMFMFKGYTLPEYRGLKHTPMAIIGGVKNIVGPDGWVVSTANPANTPSVRMLTGLGMVRQGTLKEYRFLNFTRYNMPDHLQLGEPGDANAKQVGLFTP